MHSIIIIHMRPPKVTPENYQAVQEYYAHLEPDPRTVRRLHSVMGHIYSPHLHYEEGAPEAIDELVDKGVPAVFVSTHRYIDDQFAIGVAASRDERLKILIERAFIWSKPTYFKIPFIRKFMDKVGAIPVHRDQDMADVEPVLKKANGDALMQVTARKIIDGASTAAFAEGTRNGNRWRVIGLGKKAVAATKSMAVNKDAKEALAILKKPRIEKDPRKLQRIQKGVGRIACAAEQENGKVFILPMAIWQGTGIDALERHFSPDIFIGKPIEMPFETPHKVTQRLKGSLQFCLDHAIEIGDKRS